MLVLMRLPEAVSSCVDAAGAELDLVRQAALMKVHAPALALAVSILLLDHHATNISSNKSLRWSFVSCVGQTVRLPWKLLLCMVADAV